MRMQYTELFLTYSGYLTLQYFQHYVLIQYTVQNFLLWTRPSIKLTYES